MSGIDDKLDEICEALDRLVKQLDEPAPKVLTREAAAQQLSISLTTLKGLIRNKQLVTVRIGKREMVPASEIARLAKPREDAVRRHVKRMMRKADVMDEIQAAEELLKKL